MGKKWSVAILFLAAAYVVSPIDLIPDFIPGIGYLDDGLVVLAALLPHIIRARRLLRGR